MKKLLLAALVFTILSVSDTQAMDQEIEARRQERLVERQEAEQLTQGLEQGGRIHHVIPEDQRLETAVREIRESIRRVNLFHGASHLNICRNSREIMTPIAADRLRNMPAAEQRALLEFMRDVARNLTNEEREFQAAIYRDVPQFAEIFREAVSCKSWISPDLIVIITPIIAVLTGLAVYHKDKLGNAGKQAIAWMKENKKLSITILTSIIVGGYGIYLSANWYQSKSFSKNITDGTAKLWNDTVINAWNFTTKNKLCVGIMLSGIAVGGTVGYMLSKKAATAMYDEITDQHDDDHLFVN